MTTSSMCHPHYESAKQRDHRRAREEVCRFLDEQIRLRRMIEGHRVLPVIAARAVAEARA